MAEQVDALVAFLVRMSDGDAPSPAVLDRDIGEDRKLDSDSLPSGALITALMRG